MLSAVVCFYVGRVQVVESFYILGLAIGMIFGLGLPLFNMLTTERVLQTPKEILGRSSVILRMFSIILVLIISLFLNCIEKMGIDSIYFDFSSIIVFLVSFIFSKLDFKSL